MTLPSKNDLIGRQLGHMLGRKAVNRQAVVAAIHFGDGEADAVTRLHVERLAQGAEQGGPCVERDRAQRERRHPIWGEPDVLGERIEGRFRIGRHLRSEEHTSELQSLMRISYAVFCLKKKK